LDEIRNLGACPECGFKTEVFDERLNAKEAGFCQTKMQNPAVAR